MRRLLVFPSLVEFVADIVITLLGQPVVYWLSPEQAWEANPAGLYLLRLSPWVFVVGAVLYAFLFTAAIVRLPELAALGISLGLVIAHASGTNSWLLVHGSFWEGTHNTLAAAFAAICYRAYFRRAGDAGRIAGQPAIEAA